MRWLGVVLGIVSTSGLSRVGAAAGPSPGSPPAGVHVAAHDAEISVLAATDDGRVAVSVDRRGGMRLWPSLDGKHPPVVVRSELASDGAVQLAIARDGGDIVIAKADAVGQLAVIRTTADGAPISDVRIDVERAVVALHATAHAFVALRDDQRVIAVDLRGARLGTLTASPGERIAELASRRGRLLALVTAGDRVRARWIEATGPLAWGTESPPLAIDPAHAVLAPDLARVAALARDHKTAVIVRLRDGHELERPIPTTEVALQRPLGFIDDRALAVLRQDGLFGWAHDGEWKMEGQGPFRGTPVVADRHILAAMSGGLGLATPAGVSYLGFRMVSIASAARGGHGWVVTSGTATLRLDDRFQARQRYHLEDQPASYGRTLVVLDGRHCIMDVDRKVYLVDLAHPDQRTLLAASQGNVVYEPTTRLLTFPAADGIWVGRYDPKTARFRELVIREPGWLELVDPVMNHGQIAWQVIPDGDTVTLVEIRAIDFAADDPLRTGRRLARATSPWTTDPGVVALPPSTSRARHHASPDGALVATAGDGRITLRDRAGAERWTIAHPGVADVAWTGEGELVAFGGGMARVDLATGALLARQCGWEFGRWDAFEGSELGSGLCEAP